MPNPLQPSETGETRTSGYMPWTAAQKAEMAIKLYGHPQGWTSQPGDEWQHAGGPYVVNISAIKRFYGL